MDRDRFDALAKAVATIATRRCALSLLSSLALLANPFATGEAKKRRRKKKCKKKCPPCQRCKHGKCKPQPSGISCGSCRICNSGQCVNAPDNTPCDDGNPCTVNDICTSGVCGGTPGNNGQICGTSTHGGTAIRCCNGTCPDPDCVPSGETGDSCVTVGDCAAVDCCAQQGTSCHPPCFCFFAQAGEPCGSDNECSNGAGMATACICGTCQVPPP